MVKRLLVKAEGKIAHMELQLNEAGFVVAYGGSWDGAGPVTSCPVSTDSHSKRWTSILSSAVLRHLTRMRLGGFSRPFDHILLFTSGAIIILVAFIWR